MTISVFLSTVSDEFRAYRDQLCHDLTRHDVAVKVQEDFKGLGGDTLDKLDVYIAHCDAVVHLVGEMTGAAASEGEQRALLGKYADLVIELPPLGEALRRGVAIFYTQWEAWLALYHGKLLLTAKAGSAAPRGPNFKPTDQSREAQAAHLGRMEMVRRYPDCVFASPDELAKHIAYTAILDLLVAEYAKREAAARHVAEGFIREMAGRVAADAQLDLEGMKQAVRTAIELYEREIAGGPRQTNFGDIVDQALAKAKGLTDAGKSGLARAALRKAAGALRREEEERRTAFDEGIKALCGRERDIALASYDGEGAAEAIVAMAEALHGNQPSASRGLLISEGNGLFEFGDVLGSNVHLIAAIAVRRATLRLSATPDEVGMDQMSLGSALLRLGEREGGTGRLEEAVAAYRAALEEGMRERVPLDWARTQVNLGTALASLGERESGTERLEAAAAAYRAALEELTRARVPRDWARTQINLGSVLVRLGERESGTARLEAAVISYRSALEERTRDREPLDWARTQLGLGSALLRLGERESGTARLEGAVTAYRATLEEWTRDRVPLGWAMTQMNLGTALWRLGERESGTARLEEAVTAYLAALDERTRDRVPLDWAQTQMNLGNALWSLGERESGTARLEEAVAAYRAALEQWTRDGVPLNWAVTQMNLGNALWSLGKRESGTARLGEAVAVYRAALEERTRDRVPLDWAATQMNLGNALSTLGERESGTGWLEEAVIAYRAALEERTRDRVPLDWARTQINLGIALWRLGERESGTGRLEDSLAAYWAALEELTQDRVPMEWALTQMYLGSAFWSLAGRESGTRHLQKALRAFDNCLDVTASVWPPEWVNWVRARRDETQEEIAQRSAK